ncbi:MAG: lysophospholipid acyltransferase family protein [Campylobacteraceae bacterium]|jgi:lysophospholipid acyltransferase (LPLAT)-like uncharacterized protein|nr:lysophospholipid acyltransferase family protein [Campylobacteraceae bacterium]
MKNRTLKKIIQKISPFFISLLQRAIYASCKKTYELPKEVIPAPAIWVCWHGQLLMAPYLYRKMRPLPMQGSAIVSEHINGDMAIKAAKRFKFNYIRGSSRQGAIKALAKAIKTLKNGEDIGITPDGPIGPVYSISDGVSALAFKCDVPVVAFGYSLNSFWQFKSWDKTRVPKPFSTITYRVSDPVYITDLTKEEANKKIKSALMWCMR